MHSAYTRWLYLARYPVVSLCVFLAFDKIVDYASGLSDIHCISDAIMSGVDDRLVYNAYSIPDITHILELYDMPSDVKAACQFHAGLMQYLCNASDF